MTRHNTAVHRPVPAEVDGLLQRLARCDGDGLAKATAVQIRQWLVVVERHLARERNKGLARHWSYDLNRHIALKAARDRLRQAMPCRNKADTALRRAKARAAGG